MAELLADDLYAYLVHELLDVPPDARRNARWVMNGEWFTEVRHLAESLGAPAIPVDDLHLLGRPVKVRDDGGVPHLEVTGP